MTKFFNRIRTFSIKEEGAALVEYGIILGLIVAVGATALASIGTNTNTSIKAACSVAKGTGSATC